MPSVNQAVNLTFNIQVDQANGVTTITREVEKLNQSITGVSGQVGRLARETQSLAKQNGVAASSYRSLARGVKAFLTFEISRFISSIAGAVLAVQNDLEAMDDRLETLTGSTEGANREFERMRRIAADLPATALQVSDAFATLETRGLRGTADNLESILNLSAGFGKSVSQTVEALADAQTLEFERLKEFGIRGKQAADTVSLAFQGTTTEVEKSGQAVVDAILEIGATEFEGVAERGLDNLNNAFAGLNSEIAIWLRNNETFAAATQGLTNLFNEGAAALRIYADNAVDATSAAGVNDYTDAIEKLNLELLKLQASRDALGTSDGPITSFFRDRADKDIQDLLAVLRTYELRIEDLESEKFAERLNESVFVAPDPEQPKSVIRQFETFTNDLERQIARLNGVADQSRLNQILNLGLTDEQEQAARSLFSQLQAAERRNELQKEVNKLVSDLGSEAVEATRSYQEALDTIDKAVQAGGSIADALPDSLNVTALETYREQLLSYIGPQIILDNTQATIDAVVAQNQRIAEVYAQGEAGQQVVRDLQIRNQSAHLARLQQITADAQVGDDPFSKFEQDLLEQRQKFLDDTRLVTSELDAAWAEYTRVMRDRFAESFEIPISNDDDAIVRIQKFNDSLTELAANSDKFNGQPAISQEVTDGYRRLFESFGLVTDDRTASLRDQLQALRDLNEQAFSQGVFSEDTAFENESALLARRLALWQQNADDITAAMGRGFIAIQDLQDASASSIVGGFIGGIRNITSTWDEESRKVYEINKALDLTMAANNYATGLTASFAQGGWLGWLNAIAQTATFISAFDSIKRREFGDGSTPAVGNGGGSLSQQIDGVNGVGGSGDNVINVTVLGTILDNGGLNEAIMEGVNAATRTNRLRNNNTTIRR